jgi:hypothetical protein
MDGKPTDRAEFAITTGRADVLKMLSALDGNSQDLTWNDLQKASSLKGKRISDGCQSLAITRRTIKDVKVDENTGKVVIKTSDGETLVFDAETDGEAAAKADVEKRKAIAQKNKAIQVKVDELMEYKHANKNYEAKVSGDYVIVTPKKYRTYQNVLDDFGLTEKQFPKKRDAYNQNTPIKIKINSFKPNYQGNIINKVLDEILEIIANIL